MNGNGLTMLLTRGLPQGLTKLKTWNKVPIEGLMLAVTQLAKST
jgi:hypothetical protein